MISSQQSSLRRLTVVIAGIITLTGCSAPRAETIKPKLGVVIVVDMLGSDVLARAEGHLSDRGFKRLMREGATFTNANFSHAASNTSPGHATIVTGAPPSAHGIIGDHWFNPFSETVVASVADPQLFVTGTAHAAVMTACSPQNLDAETVGDSLKQKYGPESKVFSAALKDNASVLMGGAKADGAFWFTRRSGEYITSSHYSDALPYWVEQLNRERYSESFFKSSWKRALPKEAYAKCDDDDVPYERGDMSLWDNTLPKTMGRSMPSPTWIYFSRVHSSPFGNDIVLEWARRAVIEEKLGKDDTPDLLFVGLSSPDYCGHTFGPDSHEMLDMIVQTDRQLGDWLDFLDKRVGLDNCAIVLTGDHGTTPTPEFAKKKGKDAGRIELTELVKKLNGILRAKYGTPEGGGNIIKSIVPPWIYINETTVSALKQDIDKVVPQVAQIVKGYGGIQDVVAVDALAAKPKKELTKLERAALQSAFPERSGHILFQTKPNWYFTDNCAGHGSLHAYDTHVPLIFRGPAFKAGRYEKPVNMMDLAPTLSRALGIKPPSKSQGRALTEALKR